MDLIVYEMEMPVCFGEEYSKMYGELAETLVYELFKEKNINSKLTSYECPIDLIILEKWGAEIKYRSLNKNSKILSFNKITRNHKLKYCRENKLKPLTILVIPVKYGKVEIYVKKGIKNITKGFQGELLEDFMNAMDSR